MSNNKTAEKFEFIDEILARLEDYTHGRTGEEITKARKYVADLQADQELSKRSQWVSVETSLPEKDKYVLVDMPHANPNVQHAFNNGVEWLVKVFDADNKINYTATVYNVTHWQSLPDLPRPKTD